jgi:hypothetical protein
MALCNWVIFSLAYQLAKPPTEDYQGRVIEVERQLDTKYVISQKGHTYPCVVFMKNSEELPYLENPWHVSFWDDGTMLWHLEFHETNLFEVICNTEIELQNDLLVDGYYLQTPELDRWLEWFLSQMHVWAWPLASKIERRSLC